MNNITKKDIVCSVIGFLEATIEKNSLKDKDTNESLKVAIDCINDVFGLDDITLKAVKIRKFQNKPLNVYLNEKLNGNSPIEDSSESKRITVTDNSENDNTTDEPEINISSTPINMSINYTEDHNNISNTDSTEQDEFAKLKADEYKTQGNELMNKGQYKDAINLYSKAISVYPENPAYYTNRAVANQMLNDYDNAIIDAKFSLSIDPLYSKGYTRLGDALEGKKDYNAALDAYKKVLELEGDNATEKMKQAFQNMKIKVRASMLVKSEFDSSSNKKEENNKKAGPDIGAILGDGVSAILNNPVLQQMLFKFMKNNPDAAKSIGGALINPELQNVLNNLKSGGKIDQNTIMNLLKSLTGAAVDVASGFAGKRQKSYEEHHAQYDAGNSFN